MLHIILHIIELTIQELPCSHLGPITNHCNGNVSGQISSTVHTFLLATCLSMCYNRTANLSSCFLCYVRLVLQPYIMYIFIFKSISVIGGVEECFELYVVTITKILILEIEIEIPLDDDNIHLQ